MFDKKKIFILISVAFILLGSFIFESKTLHKFIYPIKYASFVEKYSKDFNIDKNLVYSIMKAESKFREDAVSHKGAKGLMQISDITKDWAIEELELKDIDIFEPEINIKISCWYLGKLFREFGKLELVVAAYNAGSGNVTKWLSNDEYSKDGDNLHNIPFKETKDYVKKVLNNYRNYNEIYSEKGIL